MVTTAFKYIVKTPGVCGGRARIEGHRITVKDITAQVVHHGVSIEEILDGYAAAEITPSEVYAALAYYYDHQEEIEAEIAQEEQTYEEAKARGNVSESGLPVDVTVESHLTTRQASDMLGLDDPASVRSLIAQGKLEAVKWPPHHKHRATWLIERNSVEALIEQRRQKHQKGEKGRPPKLP